MDLGTAAASSELPDATWAKSNQKRPHAADNRFLDMFIRSSLINTLLSASMSACKSRPLEIGSFLPGTLLTVSHPILTQTEISVLKHFVILHSPKTAFFHKLKTVIFCLFHAYHRAKCS